MTRSRTYEIWQTTTGNLAASYPSRKAAQAVLDRYAAEHGQEIASTFVIVKAGR